METPEDRRRREYDDLQNERAERDTGRARRFLPEENRKAEQRRRDERLRSRLAELLSDPVYAASYHEAGDAIAEAQAAADAALLRTAEAIERLAQQLETLERRASRLNGEAVFVSADGKYRRADGGILSDDEAAFVERAADAPSYETYLQNVEALRTAQERRDRILGIQSDVIDPARNRHQDQNNPMSIDRLHATVDELNAVTRELSNESVVASFDAASAPASQPAQIDPAQARPLVLDLPTLR